MTREGCIAVSNLLADFEGDQMTDSMGDSPASHEGVDPPIPPLTITEDQLSLLIANTSHLVLYKLRKEMHREIDKAVTRLRIDHEKRWEETLTQLRNHFCAKAT